MLRMSVFVIALAVVTVVAHAAIDQLSRSATAAPAAQPVAINSPLDANGNVRTHEQGLRTVQQSLTLAPGQQTSLPYVGVSDCGRVDVYAAGTPLSAPTTQFSVYIGGALSANGVDNFLGVGSILAFGNSNNGASLVLAANSQASTRSVFRAGVNIDNAAGSGESAPAAPYFALSFVHGNSSQPAVQISVWLVCSPF